MTTNGGGFLICVSEQFLVNGDGQLVIDPEGSPAELAWPYTCAVGTNNGLRNHPGGGLWVAPPTLVGTAFSSGTLAHALAPVPAVNTTVTNATIIVNNPSSCHDALAMFWITAQVDFELPPGADARAAYRINADEFDRIENPAPAAGSNQVYQPAGTKVVISPVVIPAGGASGFSFPIDVGAGQGGAQYGDVRWEVNALVFANSD